MNSKLIGILPAGTLLLLIGIPSISSQTALKATVPFAFTVEKTERLLALQAFHWHHPWRIGLSIAAWTIGSCAAAELLGLAASSPAQPGDTISQPQSYETSPCSLWAAPAAALRNLLRCNRRQVAWQYRAGMAHTGWISDRDHGGGVPSASCVVVLSGDLARERVGLELSDVQLSPRPDAREGRLAGKARMDEVLLSFARRLRDIHHRVLNDDGVMDKNFGIGFFLFDRLFGTLTLQQPPFNHRGYAVAQEKFNYLEEQRAPAAWLNTNEDSRTKDNDAVLGNRTQEVPC